jgi:hypothetical protein
MNDGISNIIDHRSSLLSQFLAEVWGRPYQLGQWDCILFIAAWADRVQGGETITRQFRGQYSTEFQAIRQFAKQGINLAIARTLTRHGWHAMPKRGGGTPIPGDIILTDLHHPGVWDGGGIVCQAARASGHLRLHAHHRRLNYHLDLRQR